MLALDRLKVVSTAMRCREAWRLGPRLSLGLLRYLRWMRPTWTPSGAELNAYSPPVGGESFRRYLRGLKRISRGKPAPLLAHISVTDRCDHRCGRCSNLERGGGGPDPPISRLKGLLEGLRAAGACRVALTGGEPLLREDLPEIVELCGPSLSPLIFTSGRGLRGDGARELCRAGLAAAFVSLDHFLAEVHDAVRGVPGAFREALRAIEAFRDAGVYTAAQAVVEPPLLEDGALERFLRFCDGLGVQEVMLLEPVPVGARSPARTIDEASRQRLAGLHRRSARDPKLPKVSCSSFLESPEVLGCQAGFSFIYVSARGEVFPCDFAPLSFGNAFDRGIEEILDRLEGLIRRPSRRCLALRIEELHGDGLANPIPWEKTRTILGRYDPGEPPGLMRYLNHG